MHGRRLGSLGLILLGLAGLAGLAACSAPAPPATPIPVGAAFGVPEARGVLTSPIPPPGGPFTVRYELTGGIAGIRDVLQVDEEGQASLERRGSLLGTLPLSKISREALGGQITAADFFNLQAKYDSGNVADDLYHTITITRSGQTRTVMMADVGGRDLSPEGLRNLVAGLRQVAATVEGATTEGTGAGSPSPGGETPTEGPAMTATPTLPPTVTATPPTGPPVTSPAPATNTPRPASATVPVTSTVAPSATVPMTATSAPPPPATNTPPPPAPSPPPPATAGPNLGGFLAYVADKQIWLQKPPANMTPTVLVADPSLGSGVAPSNLRWAPTGRRLVYEIEPTAAMTQPQVLVYDVDNNKVINLGEGHGPAWNAAGNRVALIRSMSDVDRVVVYTLKDDGSRDDGLIVGAGSSPAWLPPRKRDGQADQERLALVRDGNIWLLAYPPGGEESQLTRIENKPDDPWFITGLLYHYSGRILFYGGQRSQLGAQGNGLRLYAADLASGAISDLLGTPGNGLVQMEISPGGGRVALAYQSHNSACESDGVVEIYDLTTGRSTGLKLPNATERHAHLTGISWAPGSDGRLAVAYSEFSCAPGKEGDLGPARLYLANMDGTLGPALADGTWPAWNRGREALGHPNTVLGGSVQTGR